MTERLSRDKLDDQYHGLLLSTFLKLRKAVKAAKFHGLDQAKIASRIGMDEAQLSRVLRGESNVTLKTMHRIARAADCRLDVDVVELADLKPSNHPSWKISGYTKLPELIKNQQAIRIIPTSGAGRSAPVSEHWVNPISTHKLDPAEDLAL